jgi:hypothetical protein
MNINHTNYEEFIIDYLDNKLSPVDTANLLLFLEQNPEIKEEMQDMGNFTLKAELSEHLGFKESLYQPNDVDALNLSPDNYPHYFIAASEGDLSSEGISRLNSFLLAHPELREEYKLYTYCKVKPQSRIVYPEKDKLKIKQKSVFIRYYFATGIAAGLLLLATVYFRLTPDNDSALDKALRSSVEYQATHEGNKTARTAVEENKQTAVIEEQTEGSVKKQVTIKDMPKPAKKSTTANEIKHQTPIKKIGSKPMIINTTPLISDNHTRSFYSNLYDDIRLSQELALANEEDTEELNERQMHQQRISGVKTGRILSSVIRSGEQIAAQIPESLNVWLLADIGINGFNFITNNDYKLERSYAGSGTFKNIAVVEK